MDGQLISIVVPTFNRPFFLKRALKSVLKQTYKNIEIIVVVDGVSSQTKQLINQMNTSSIPIKLIQTQEKVGGSEARNIGVREAKGEFVALLDDDDEWFEDKLHAQINVLKNKIDEHTPFLCFTSLLRYKDKDRRVYTRLPNINYKDSKKYTIPDYLFETKGLRNMGFIQTSTVLVPRWLLIETPFTKGLPKHQDWDWLLKIDQKYKLNIFQVEEPKIIYHSDVPKNSRIGYINRWSFTEKWMNCHKHSFSKKGHDSFILNYIMLGIAEDNSISRKKRVIELKKRWGNLSLSTKLSPYCWKMIIYILFAFKNN